MADTEIEDAKDDKKSATDEATKSASVATSVAAAALKRYTEEAESLRQRSDLAAKVLVGAGSTLITAIGIAKFSDLYPLPPADAIPWLDGVPWKHLPGFRTHVELAILGVIVGFALMIATVMWIASRYWKVTEPLPMRSDLNRIRLNGSKRLEGEERRLVEDAYDDMARLNDVSSLLAYEARAHRLERVAKWLPIKEAEQVRSEATLIQTEVLTTHTQARLRILRRRVASAVRGPWAIVLYAMFVVGVVMFGLGTDYLSSERADAITVAKACADARAVDKAVDLPAICGPAIAEKDSDEMEEGPPQISAARLALAALFQECVAETERSNSPDAGACDGLTNALTSLGP